MAAGLEQQMRTIALMVPVTLCSNGQEQFEQEKQLTAVAGQYVQINAKKCNE